jgi:hypothetical protein
MYSGRALRQQSRHVEQQGGTSAKIVEDQIFGDWQQREHRVTILPLHEELATFSECRGIAGTPGDIRTGQRKF